MKKYFKYSYLVFSLLILSACSIKYVYNHLDWIVVSYIEDIALLDEDQSELLNAQLEKSLNWHRKTQLPEYAKWLQSFRNDIDTGLNAKIVESHLETVTLFFQNTTLRLNDDVYVLLPQLTEEQVKAIEENFTGKSRDFHEDFIDISKEDLKQQELEKLIERFEFWIDDLTEPQLILLSDTAKNFDIEYQERYERQLKWQKEFILLLNQARTGKNVKQDIRNLLSIKNKFRTKRVLKKAAQRKQRFITLIVAISKTITKEQKLYLFEKIDNYKTLFNELYAELNE
jgi:hypothetical protein